MTIAMIVLQPGDERELAAFLANNRLENQPQILWRVSGAFFMAEQLLAPLEALCQQQPATLLLFPGSPQGDELATRLAWRLQGSAACRVSQCSVADKTLVKAAYGSALTAMLAYSSLPLCISVARDATVHAAYPLMPESEENVVPHPLRAALSPPQCLERPMHPLQSARAVLATGQGASAPVFTELAHALKAELGFTRQRIMCGGCDEQRMLGVSGQAVAPAVCIIAGASGAAAFMAGVNQSEFIVAINTDPAAPVFAAADVGIVGDAEEVLQALAACRSVSD